MVFFYRHYLWKKKDVSYSSSRTGKVAMKTRLSYFTTSFIVCFLALIAGFIIGGTAAVATIFFLTVLEVALSFDNAVVNAGVLKNWNHLWRQHFLVWGIFVAVFGMRLVFPLAIVSVVAHINPVEAINIALYQPEIYSHLMAAAHHQVAAFGGVFLMMVFLSFFVARHKTEHWLAFIEKPLTRLGQMEAIQAALTLATLTIFTYFVAPEERFEFLLAGMWGLIVYVFTKGAASLLSPHDAQIEQHVVHQGIGGFLYLELIDASFSFDGVLGAFAMTNNLFIIALGLGAGAMFVRSFTVLLVEKGTLNHYRYLEHGAFWAIGSLAFLMLLDVILSIPEAITGLLGAVLILASLGSSILANRQKS